MNKDQLKAKYLEYKNKQDPDFVWTDADEEGLQKLESGEITKLQETAIFGNALKAKNEILYEKILSHPVPCQVSVLSDAVQQLKTWELRKLQASIGRALQNTKGRDDSIIVHRQGEGGERNQDDDDDGNSLNSLDTRDSFLCLDDDDSLLDTTYWSDEDNEDKKYEAEESISAKNSSEIQANSK